MVSHSAGMGAVNVAQAQKNPKIAPKTSAITILFISMPYFFMINSAKTFIFLLLNHLIVLKFMDYDE
jgi:hypothetical protein